MCKVGFVGLGIMGAPMSGNLMKDGYSVMVFNRSRVPMEAAAADGAEMADSLAHLASECGIIFTMLPNSPQVKEVILGEGGLASAAKPGTLFIDMTSGAPGDSKEIYAALKEKELHIIDAPVSGGEPMAIAGTLAIMTGGDKEAFEQVKPLLECMGHPVYTGGAGSGSVTKLVNNIVAGAYMVVIAEAYAFAAKAGIDLQTTFEATRGGFAGGPVYDNKVPKLIHRDYEPGARVAVHRKDILNAKHFAHHMGVDTPMTDVVLMVMDWMNDNGHINEDQIAMVKYYEDKMDVTVGEEK